MAETVETIAATRSFVDHFELVLDNDWQMTRDCLANPTYLIDPNGTFLQPGVDDESNNWTNRGALLASYRRLKSLLEAGDASGSAFRHSSTAACNGHAVLTSPYRAVSGVIDIIMAEGKGSVAAQKLRPAMTSGSSPVSPLAARRAAGNRFARSGPSDAR
jgi:hypothetical protein